MTELEACDKMIYDAVNVGGITGSLGASTALYNAEVPVNALLPAIYWRYLPQSGNTNSAQNKQRTEVRAEFMVLAVTAGGAYNYTLQGLIDTALNNVTVTVSPYFVSCIQVAPLESSFDIDGKRFKQIGGRYLFTVLVGNV